MAIKSGKLRYGFKNVKYAKITEATDGSVTFGTPKVWKGAISLTLNPEGESDSIYADDSVYHTTTANNGYTGTLTMVDESDDFKKEIMGYKELEEGDLVETNDAVVFDFALCAEFSSELGGIKKIFYRCTPGRLKYNANTTEDKISPDKCELDITIAPIVVDGTGFITRTVKEGSSKYATLFDSIVLPTIEE